MSDHADEAAELQELAIQAAQHAHQKAAARLKAALGEATGRCLNCQEEIEEGRFCDEDCREDFQKRVKARR